ATIGERPALLIVDVVRGFTGDRGESLAASVARFRSSCGPYAWASIPRIAELARAARGAGWPIIFTRASSTAPRSPIQVRKNARVASNDPTDREAGNQFLPELAPEPGDLVIEKPRPSAFFGTGLLDELRRRGVDHLVVTGATTSGCVRATVNDGFSNDVPMLIPHECVFDRFPTSHRVELFDINAKYADVISVVDLLEHLGAAAGAAVSSAAGAAVERAR
ncbi:MAG TPA: isochorismatase family protein, partial [Candidatus Limnocylindrales bacterium]|nr:isochorismatase family protein [Candidatus Limnocylindrales bacterium]